MTSPTTKLPRDCQPIHFIGIGGIGMSGIAEILLAQGYQVQGSDLKESAITTRLATLGAEIFIGQRAENLGQARVVVISTAIKPGNAELDAARESGLPVVHRSEMLAELMRLKSNIAVAGTHGKTTTTTMVAELLSGGGFDPSVINGGVIHSYGSNARAGAGEWMVVEADESDGSFNRLPATIGIVTNIDPEHMEHWGTEEALHQGFRDFISDLPFYGLAVCCIDDPDVCKLIATVTDRPLRTYGFADGADIQAVGLRYDAGVARFDIVFNGSDQVIRDCSLPMPGDHNVSNALAAVAVADQLGMSGADIRETLANFGGVNRRFTRVGDVNGVTIIDDYGHHPVEIEAVLKAAKHATSGRVLAVHQPHRYSRLSDLFDAFCRCFDDADIIGITDVYSAGEAPIAGADRDALVTGLTDAGHPNAVSVADEEALHAFLMKEGKPGDMLICLGAGTISSWAHGLVEKGGQG